MTDGSECSIAQLRIEFNEASFGLFCGVGRAAWTGFLALRIVVSSASWADDCAMMSSMLNETAEEVELGEAS